MMIKNLSRYIDPERISENVELKDYTTFKVGGPADIMVTVDTVSELTGLIAYLSKCMANDLVIGNGSNLLVSDEGYKGIVIRLSGEFRRSPQMATRLSQERAHHLQMSAKWLASQQILIQRQRAL